MTGAAWHERPLTRAVGFLAFLAYLPALTAAPGRMPSDSKLYLYLDPGRFIGDAASTFDPRQFAGWVPHQHVGYLWPSGPWFWVFETLGAPDWIAHRLWIGTLMLAAGLGVRWCARLLGLGATAAIAAAIVYQLSLYVLPYVSRTSVMLLPWAGLGWVVAFTIRATRRRTWGDPGAIALVVLTVGAVNATALAMIVPGPVLWLLHAASQRSIGWGQAAVVALRTAVLALAVSVWWISMLLIQGRYGTDVLPYSESLADVSLTSTSPETWRALGYWLFYVRDPYAATTTESLRYLASTPAIVVSFAVPLIALGAVGWIRWAHRRYAAALIAVGLVLAVGVHPIDDRSPLMRLVAGDDEGGLALALRSSTRALPVTMLGVALAFAMIVDASAGIRFRWTSVRGDRIAVLMLSLLAVANLPALWTGGFVDPALERDQDPPDAWIEASSALDRADAGGRVLQLPGAEFGAYRWGYTVDQPLPGLTEAPLVTRDLLPLGSPGAMDLLFALDDRIQQGVLEPEALVPVARLLGVDTVWLTNDHAFDRFRTARPEVVRDLVIDAPGVERVVPYGEIGVNRPDVPVTDERAVGDPRVGRPLVPVELAEFTDPGRIVRAAEAELVVSGSGDGLVDAAAVDLLASGRAVVRYSADLDDESALGTALGVVVTDSNRDRARHWRGSQDTVGFTEPGGPEQGVLRPSASDARLDVFATTDPSTQTIAVQRGPVVASATSYGEPFAYLPEHRAAMAVDGDRATAWIVGEHGDPIDETIRLEAAEPIVRLVLHQAAAEGDRRISRISVRSPDTHTTTIDLDESSWNGAGQTIELGTTTGQVDLTIDAVTGGTPFTGSFVAGVGFAEIDAGLGPTTEVVRPPHDALDSVSAATPLALTFTRLRSDPMNRWRDDPEPELVREVDLPAGREFEVGLTMRVDARASDAELASMFGWPVVADSRLTGSPRHAGVAAFDSDPDTAWITAFGEARGATIATRSDAPIESIEIDQPVTGFSSVRSMTVRSGGEERVVNFTPGAAGASVGAVDPPLPAGEVTFTIDGLDAEVTIDRRFADPVALPAAINELRFDGRPKPEPPGSGAMSIDCIPVASVDGRAVTARVEISGDGWLDGGAISAIPCGGSISLEAGTNLLTGGAELPLVLDRITLDDGVRRALGSVGAPPTVEVIDQSRFARTVRIDRCAAGCWLIVGEGYNEAWTAAGPDGSLGPSRPVDGGFNGWWIEPTGGSVVVEVSWTAQRALSWALALTVVAALFAAALVARDLRSRRSGDCIRAATPRWWADSGLLPERSRRLTAVLWPLLAGLLVSPVWALWGALGGLVAVVTGRRRLPELTALAGLLVAAGFVTVRERRIAPLPNGGWPTAFEPAHGLGMFAVASLLVGALVALDAVAVPDDPGDGGEERGDDTVNDRHLDDTSRTEPVTDTDVGSRPDPAGDPDERTAIRE